MEIKLLKEQHAKEYWELRLEALQKNPEAFGSSYEETIKRTSPIESTAERLVSKGSYTYGCFEEEKLAGVVTLVCEHGLKTKHKASIYAMYVTPAFRGTGVARKLMESAIQQAKDLPDVEQVMLTVVTTNEMARRLYLSLGFIIYGSEKRALKYKEEYYDEELMVLFLDAVKW